MCVRTKNCVHVEIWPKRSQHGSRISKKIKGAMIKSKQTIRLFITEVIGIFPKSSRLYNVSKSSLYRLEQMCFKYFSGSKRKKTLFLPRKIKVSVIFNLHKLVCSTKRVCRFLNLFSPPIMRLSFS